ncbi:MAG TPA: NADH-quinone oxidoreductase subunit C [Tichowtungia sp.]|nr:NADH-quinone oxidoreductase subunit C [Tichowtungia sp.]
MSEKILTPEEIVSEFQALLGDGLQSSRVQLRAEGLKTRKSQEVWLTLDKDLLNDALAKLATFDYPHLAVISGVDVGEAVELIYHFFIYYGRGRGNEIKVSMTVSLPKDDLTVDTISGIIPGAVFSEREKQEFLGIDVIGIPDSRRLFIPDHFPEGLYPWRKDETGITIEHELAKELWRVGRDEAEAKLAAKAAAAAPAKEEEVTENE